MSSGARIALAFTIGLLAGVVISLANRQDLVLALQSGFAFAVFVAIVVALLSWGVDIAVKRGYPDWMGFLLVLILNVFGLLLLSILPNRTMTSD